MRRFLLVANVLIGAINLFVFGADPGEHAAALPLGLLCLLGAWVVYGADRRGRAAERMAGQWQTDLHQNLGLEGVHPSVGWQHRLDGTTVPIRFVPTDDPTVFLAVTIDGDPVWPGDGGITVDRIGPGQAVVFKRTEPS